MVPMAIIWPKHWKNVKHLFVIQAHNWFQAYGQIWCLHSINWHHSFECSIIFGSSFEFYGWKMFWYFIFKFQLDASNRCRGWKTEQIYSQIEFAAGILTSVCVLQTCSFSPLLSLFFPFSATDSSHILWLFKAFLSQNVFRLNLLFEINNM